MLSHSQSEGSFPPAYLLPASSLVQDTGFFITGGDTVSTQMLGVSLHIQIISSMERRLNLTSGTWKVTAKGMERWAGKKGHQNEMAAFNKGLPIFCPVPFAE